MPRKVFQVQVELEIQAVTCPGVWLCPNGKVSVQMYMLDSCVQTISVAPVFPLLIHEKFMFFKTFSSAQTLTDLQRLLRNEVIYAELIQWQNCEIGSVLASFETTLAELLYPTIHEGAIAGIDIDLLMEPEKHFPGIIAPKLEVSTKTTIEERHCRDDTKLNNAFVVNPKVISSHCHEKSPIFRQRKVCHSSGYHRKQHTKRQSNPKPPFVVKRVQDNLLTRKPQGLDNDNEICQCMKHYKNSERLIDKIRFNNENFQEDIPVMKTKVNIPSKKSKSLPRQNINVGTCLCTCGHHHTQQACPVCTKYKHYFKKGTDNLPTERSNKICPKTGNFCCCGSINEVEDIQTSRSKSRRCDCSGNCNRYCFCPGQKQPSLAERLHERLSRTLGSCVDCPYPDDQNLSTIIEQNCPPNVECQCGNFSSNDVLDNLERACKNLQQTITCKSNNSSRYITSC